MMNAVGGHGADSGTDALPLKQPVGTQHVITVADQDCVGQAKFIEHAPAVKGVFFGASAVFFHQDGRCRQSALQQDLAAGVCFAARVGFGLRAGANGKRGDAFVPQIRRPLAAAGQRPARPTVMSQSCAQHDDDIGGRGCVAGAGAVDSDDEAAAVEQGREHEQ